MRLASEARTRMEEIVCEMGTLAQTSREIRGVNFHYLRLHRRPKQQSAACILRWRNPRHDHVRWEQVARDLKQLPLGLREMYVDMDIRAQELNALHMLYHNEHATLSRLAQVYGRRRNEPGIGKTGPVGNVSP